MIILGTSFDYHDAAAALFVDGKLAAACMQERYSRRKHDPALPLVAIDNCLTLAGVRREDIDAVAHYENPLRKFDRLVWTAKKTNDWTSFNETLRSWFAGRRFEVRQRIGEALGKPEGAVHYIDHHLSHAASAFYFSPFERAAVVTLDGVGEYETATISEGAGTGIRRICEARLPHSLGLFYSAFTAFLGFEVNEGEYKVMGMAGFGEPRMADEIIGWFDLREDGSFGVDQRNFDFLTPREMPFNHHLIDRFGPPRPIDGPFRVTGNDELARQSKYYADIAASVQAVTERVVRHVVASASRQCGTKQVCLAGGVALNSLANGRLVREDGYELFVQPAAGDAGGALGAAAELHHRLGGKRITPLDSVLLGSNYQEAACESAVRKMGLKVTSKHERPADMVADVARRLANGQVCGWFQGRAEWGPRALGCRSILADPTRPEMQLRVNEAVKHREPFRPFAPSVPANAVSTYFETGAGKMTLSSPETFMLCVHPVRSEWRQKLPAITHADGSARVHAVHPETNPLFHDLLTEFGRLSGTPVLLNTSFNLRGDPIVETPEDAIGTFLYSGMDFLALGNLIVAKE